MTIVISGRNMTLCVLEVAQMPVVAQNCFWKLLTDPQTQALQSGHEAVLVILSRVAIWRKKECADAQSFFEVLQGCVQLVQGRRGFERTVVLGFGFFCRDRALKFGHPGNRWHWSASLLHAVHKLLVPAPDLVNFFCKNLFPRFLELWTALGSPPLFGWARTLRVFRTQTKKIGRVVFFFQCGSSRVAC